MSPSSRGRGLKYCAVRHILNKKAVALFTRAWIEILSRSISREPKLVALFTRAWIEIYILVSIFCVKGVALLTRAWIEIDDMTFLKKDYNRRPLHEGVD